jgi:hypothetical protein
MQVNRTPVSLALSILLVGMSAVASAQEAGSKSASGDRFFAKNDVDFWGDKAAKRLASKTGSSANAESIWAEPMVGTDGRVSVYVPPKHVLSFLQNPTKEGAKAYLAWQSERAGKLKAAIEALRDVRDEKKPREEGSKPPTDASVAPQALRRVESNTAPAPGIAGEILYFKKSDCGYCEKEDRALGELAGSSPGVKIQEVPSDDSRWTEYGITATPSLVVIGADGRRVLVRGYATSDQLKKIVEEVNRVHK